MFLQVCFVDANWDSSSIYIHCMILFYFWLKKGFIIDIMFRRSIFIDLWVLYFFQILEYYHEAFVPILKGLALFFFYLPNLHLLLELKMIQKKLSFSYEVVGIRSSCYCSMKLNVISKERLCLLKFLDEKFWTGYQNI